MEKEKHRQLLYKHVAITLQLLHAVPPNIIGYNIHNYFNILYANLPLNMVKIQQNLLRRSLKIQKSIQQHKQKNGLPTNTFQTSL